MMLQKPKSRKTAILKYGLSAPLFLIAMVLSSATISENKTIKEIENQIQPAQPIAEILVPKIAENMVTNDEKLTEEIVSQQTPNSLIIDVDFSALKSHLNKTLKYPLNARLTGVVGKVGLELNIKNGIITNLKAINSPNEELKKEALSAFSSFSGNLNAESGNYSIILNFIIVGEKNETKRDKATNFGVLKNYIGEVVISAYDYALNEVKVVGYASKNDEAVISNPETLPGFPGGLTAFSKFLAANLRYPAIARENNIQGRVFLSFVVEKDGSLSDIKVARGIGGGCDEEAVRVIAISPKWNAGMQNGKAVRVSYTIPVFFQMNNNGKFNVAGVNISATKSDSIRVISGLSSIVKTNNFLLIIDGKEIEMGSKEELNDIIKPEDIESVNVIKDEAAIKLYGGKGKNGVIQITTKKKK